MNKNRLTRRLCKNHRDIRYKMSHKSPRIWVSKYGNDVNINPENEYPD